MSNSISKNIKNTRLKIKNLEKELSTLEIQLSILEQKCKHKFIEVPDNALKMWIETGDLAWKYERTECIECNTIVKGWRCHSSPDEICHYTTIDGRNVRLTNGDLYLLPETHEAEDESYDYCIFCEHPEERK